VELRHTVERDFRDEHIECRFFEHVRDGRDGLVRVVAVRRDVDLLDGIGPDEFAANLREFLAEERLATREVQVFDRAEAVRQLEDLVLRQVIALVEARPVEAVLALHVADAVDEENEEGRARPIEVRVAREPQVARNSADEIQRSHVLALC
jgi:hypothetical protein